MGTPALTSALQLLAWALLWGCGGIWIARAAFRLESAQNLTVGLAIGLAAENLAANLIGRFLPFPMAVWTGAFLVFLGGLFAGWRQGGVRSLLQVRRFPFETLVGLAAVTLFAFVIGRGLSIFDDYMVLPTTSLMATGDLPPHFALDPAVPYDYHYFLLLLSAQMMRAGGIFVWVANDLSRGMVTGLAVVLAYQWTQRVTGNRAAGWLGSAFLLFGSGTRWLLLFLPQSLLLSVSRGLVMLGSGAGSGADLFQALANPWAVEGSAPVSFPFAFANGIYPAGVLNQFIGNGLCEAVFLLALLVSFKRWRSALPAGLASALIISASMLLTETGVVLEIGGWALVVLISALRARSLRLPKTLWAWLLAAGAGYLLGALQGGALVAAVGQALRLVPAASYHTLGFRLVFPPTIVSSHLGVLSLVKPGQILLALVEMGPLLLVFPLLGIWGWKALRAGRWLESALVAEAFLSLGMLFVQYAGSEGVRNTSRLYRFMFILAIFAVPLVWNWARKRGRLAHWLAGSCYTACSLGGVVMLSLALPAIQRPVNAYFISDLDAKISVRYWNQLERDATIFDATPYRAPAVFGRFTDSSSTWYLLKPDWKVLFKTPLPAQIHSAGFSYAYLDNFYFRGLPPEVQAAWLDSCVKVVAQENHGENWRRLYALRDCH